MAQGEADVPGVRAQGRIDGGQEPGEGWLDVWKGNCRRLEESQVSRDVDDKKDT
jgi:hypothetical protein